MKLVLLAAHTHSIIYMQWFSSLGSSGPPGYASHLLSFKLQRPVVENGHSRMLFSLHICSFTYPPLHSSSDIWVTISIGLMGIIHNLMGKPRAENHSNVKASITPIFWGLQRNLSWTSYNPITLHRISGLTLFLLQWFCHCLKGTL